MKLLCFETSAKTASAAIVSEGRIFAEGSLTTGLTHSQTLMPLCQSLMQSAGLPLREIDLLAVSTGPGSFTGLRIGISAAKGLAQGSSKRCVGVSTLEALACNLMGLETLACPVMDARCKQVYTALFRVSGGYPQRLWPDCALSLEELGEKLEGFQEPVMLTGDGACLAYEALAGKLPMLRLSPPGLRLQRAASVGFAALAYLKNGEPVPPGELLPQYLRLPQAERELLKKQQAAQAASMEE